MDFDVIEELEPEKVKIFEMNYYQDNGLHNLEAFAEGTFTIGGKL